MIITPFFLKSICCFLLLFAGAEASAQHCPYDGMYMIVVHVPEQVTQPGGTTLPRLTEVDNNEAGNCHAARGLLQKTFLSVSNLLHDSLNLLPNKAVVNDFCSDCAYLGAGYYAVKLTQQERYCLLYDSSKNLERRPRKFEVWYGAQKIALPPEQVYRLCWAEGAWSRIQPVEIPGLAPQKRTGLESSKPNKAYKKLNEYDARKISLPANKPFHCIIPPAMRIIGIVFILLGILSGLLGVRSYMRDDAYAKASVVGEIIGKVGGSKTKSLEKYGER